MPTLDEAIDGVLTPPAKQDPLAAAIAQTLQDDRVRTQQNLIGATRSNPDEAAKAVRLGAERGLPSDLVLRNLHEIQSRSVVDAANATLETSPTLKRLVTERPDLPKQAIDEIDKLADLERRIREHGALREYKGPEPSAGSIATGLAKTIPQTLTSVRDSIRLQMGDLLDSLGLLPEDEVTKRERMRRAEQSLGRTTYDDPNFESATAGAVYGGLKSTVQQGTGLAASILTGNPVPALATIGLQTEAQAYTKYRARGAGGGMAALGGGLEGALEVGTELLPMKFLVNKLGKAGFGEFVSGLLGREMIGEQIATFTQDAVDTAIANPDKTWEQFLAERPAAAYQTAVAVITQSLVMGGANAALERYARATNQVNDAGRDADVMRALAALSAQVQLRERNPDEFRAMLQSMAEDAQGAPTQVRFDARTLVGEDGAGGLLNQEEMAQFPGLAEQMAEAVSTGGEIVIPVSELLTVAPGTPLEQKLLENARIGDNELSQLEAKEAAAQAETYLQQEAERVMAGMQDADTVRASAEVVKQTVVDQLNAAKRFTTDVNEAYATLVQSFYTVLANRMGMTPEQAYAAYPLRVQGENPAAPGEVLNAGEQTATPEFKRWFGDSKVTTQRGDPMVVYHGAPDARFVKEDGIFKTLNEKYGYRGSNEDAKRAFFFTDSRRAAGTYADDRRAFDYQNAEPGIVDTYLSIKNPLVIDAGGRHWREAQQRGKDDFILEAKAAGHDGVIIRNVLDDYNTPTKGGRPIDVFVAFSSNQIKSATGNRGTFDPNDPSILNQAAVANETEQDRANSLDAMRVSPRMPTAVKATEDALGETRLQPDLATAKRDPVAFAHNIELMAQYPNFQGLEGTADEKAEAIIEHAVGNLLWLHDHWKPEYRDRSKMWYVGGNRIAHRWAARFGVSPEHVAGVIAATSPQKDWFQNVSLAERILEAVVNNADSPWTPEMSELVRRRDWGPKAVPDPSVYEGKTLRDLHGSGTPGALLDMAIWIRAWDEANNVQQARVITPEGGFADFDKGKTGKPIALHWQSFPAVVKTLEVLMTRDVASISKIIGANHKVRSFYNNIIAPFAGEDVTIDTHAVAAALLRPLGSSDTEVFHNFGSGVVGSAGPKNSAITGLYGTYAIYAEAYRRAAAQRDVLPREMQSITWEAVRGLFRPEQKTETIKAEADRLWAAAASGESNANDTRSEVQQLVGGIADPAWVGSDPGADAGAGDSSYAREVPRAGGAAGAADGRGGVDAATGVQPSGSTGVASDVFEQPAYHGTPYRGIDKFSTEHIGKGEGAQVYGWGLYFASNAEIAEFYRKQLSDWKYTLDGVPLEDIYDNAIEKFGPVSGTLLRFASDDGISSALGAAEAYVQDGSGKGFGDPLVENASVEELRAAVELLKQVKRKHEGQLYEVDVPNDDELLAYDAPLKDQPPKVKAALEKLGIPMTTYSIVTPGGNIFYEFDTLAQAQRHMTANNIAGTIKSKPNAMTGSEAYKELTRRRDLPGLPGSADMAPDEAASKALLAAGVKGLKYLDANSRGPTASKNYNFVVFSGDDVAIRNQYYQGPRGTFNPNTLTVSLLQSANLSTFLHETGHFFLEVLADVGSQPNAPTGVVDDMGKLLNWFGVKDLATWNGMTLDQKRKHHERFAESFEQYLLEGKAPNPELQPLFQRFRAWLVNVYRSLSEFMRGRNLELSDEVRGVFDRMLATDQQIKQAEDLRAYSLLFKSAEQAGMTPEAWAEYQRQGAQATHDAIDKLQARSVKDMRWISGARSRALKNLQREAEGKRRAIEAEVSAEVAQQPTYQAMRWLRKGEMTTAEGEEIKAEKGFRLNTAALAEMYPDTALDNPDLARLKGLTAANGLHPDVVAAMFGFDSGDTLVRTLVEAQPQAAVVEGMTDQRMLERFGDLATPQGLARAADEAVHNEARGRFIATGLRALQEANGKTEKTATGGSVNVMVRAAKQFAEQLVARRKVRELKPGQHTQAEQRAGRAAQKAMAANDTQAAIVAQRDQLLNHYAARATNDAIDETERSLAYLKKFDKESIRKKLPIEYVDQIDKLLERVDLRQQTNAAIDKRSKLAAWIKSQQDMGIEVELPDYLLEDAKLTSYKDMSVEAFRGLVATVKQIEHLGRLKNKLLTAKDEREFAAIRDSMVQSVLDNAGSREADTRTPTTVLGKKLAAVKAFGAAHIKAATYARIFDGGKDGGPVWEYLVRPANAAADRETKMNAQATAELSEILDPWRKAGNPNRRTPAPSIGRSLTRQERLVIALNIGNEGNLQRLLGGEGWTPAQLNPVLDELTKEDWRTVQAVWDHFETRRALIDEVERNVYGKPLKKVDPGSMFTEAYKVKGGYYPIVYDPAASQRAEEHADAEAAKRQLAGAYSAAHVRRGFTKARAEEVGGRPLMYDLSGVYRGVRDQLHYIAWTEWVIDANRILRDKAFDAAVREKYGPDAVRQLKSWRDAIAEGDGAAQEAMDTALGWMRRSVSVAGLGFNVMSAMIQPLGFTQSITRVGAGWIGKGVLHYLGNPVAVTRDVNSKSDFMANRSRTRFREINELRNRVEQQTAAKRIINENAYALMMRCQQLVDVPTWWGAYEKAIAGGNTEDRARALADQAVIDAQGGGQTKDLSAIERGGPAQKMFTVFYSFMNTALNLGVTSKMTPTGKAKFAADMLMLYVAPAVLGVVLKNALTPGDSGDEDKKLLQKLLAEQIGYLFGLMVLGREVGEAAKTALGLSDHPRDYAGPAGVRALADSYQFAKQAGQGEFDNSFRKAAVNLAGDLMGLPSAQLNRTITGAQALKEGKTKNPAALLFGYQEPR